MSMWFRFDESAPRDPRVLELGVLLGDEDKALACLVRLWAWERSGAPTGTVKGERADAIVERAAGWRGEPSAFAAACVTVRLLVRTRSGLRSPGFAQRSGVVHERSTRDAERMRAYRAAQKASRDGATGGSEPVQLKPNGAAPFGERSPNVQGYVTVRDEDETKATAAAVRERSPDVQPPASVVVRPMPTLATDGETPEALLAAWTAAAAPHGRGTLPELTARLRSKARSRLNEAPCAVWARVFELVCACDGLWTPSPGRGWVASLGWALSGGPALESARAGTYGPWERPAAKVAEAPRPCACCSRPSRGQVYGTELCEAHAAEAVRHEAGARAWVESRRAAA